MIRRCGTRSERSVKRTPFYCGAKLTIAPLLAATGAVYASLACKWPVENAAQSPISLVSAALGNPFGSPSFGLIPTVPPTRATALDRARFVSGAP